MKMQPAASFTKFHLLILGPYYNTLHPPPKKVLVTGLILENVGIFLQNIARGSQYFNRTIK